MPTVPTDCVHRVVRTARIKAEGEAITFVRPEDEGDLRGIERAPSKPISRVTTRISTTGRLRLQEGPDTKTETGPTPLDRGTLGDAIAPTIGNAKRRSPADTHFYRSPRARRLRL